MTTARAAPFSLRTLGMALAVLLGLLMVSHTVALVWTSRVVWRLAQDAERESHAVDATKDLDRMLREHHRQEALWLAKREPEAQATLSALDSDLRELAAQMEAYVGDPVERSLLDDLAGDVAGYLSTREAAEARGLALEEAIEVLRPSFERTLVASTRLRQQSEASRAESRERAERALRGQGIVVLVCGSLSMVGLALIGVGVRRVVVRPIVELSAAVQRFRSGDAGEPALGGPLRETRELAVRFNEMIDAIQQQRRDQLTSLAAVAHDLRNPLSGLKMIVRSLEREPGEAKTERLRRLDRQLDGLTRMVGDLLDATRIEAGHLELQPERFDLRDAARTVTDLYAPTTTAHQLMLHVPAQPLFVHGDPLRLEQVIGNLVSNAIKYSPCGGPVEVSVSATDGGAEVVVSDRGIGVPPADLPNMFLPFRRRLDTATLASGVGLGLSIARRIVRAHGGHIDVESKPGVGSTFRVWLPLEARERAS